MNRSIKDALVAEEKFFRSRPVRKCHCLAIFSPCHLYMLILFMLFVDIQWSSRQLRYSSIGKEVEPGRVFATLKAQISFCYLFYCPKCWP